MRLLTLMTLIPLAACTSGAGDDTDVTVEGARSLDNCATTSDGVPAFYSRYWKCVDMSVDGTEVSIHTTDLPPHLSYYYGVGEDNYEAFDTRDGSWHPNPNLLAEQDFTITIPASPVSLNATIDETTVNGSDDHGGEYPGGFGVALDGTVIFSGFAAPGDDINQEKYTFDSYEAHPENTGRYHYHGASPGPLEVLAAEGLTTSTTPGSADIELYGIMCDGTVVLGCTELDGSAVDSTDLDAQGGHVSDIVDDEGTTHFTGRYHTHVCAGIHEFAPEIQYYDGCDAFQH
jgi:hypothetical protein